jgi:hypothetical protein
MEWGKARGMGWEEEGGRGWSRAEVTVLIIIFKDKL